MDILSILPARKRPSDLEFDYYHANETGTGLNVSSPCYMSMFRDGFVVRKDSVT